MIKRRIKKQQCGPNGLIHHFFYLGPLSSPTRPKKSPITLWERLEKKRFLSQTQKKKAQKQLSFWNYDSNPTSKHRFRKIANDIVLGVAWSSLCLTLNQDLNRVPITTSCCRVTGSHGPMHQWWKTLHATRWNLLIHIYLLFNCLLLFVNSSFFMCTFWIRWFAKKM